MLILKVNEMISLMGQLKELNTIKAKNTEVFMDMLKEVVLFNFNMDNLIVNMGNQEE